MSKRLTTEQAATALASAIRSADAAVYNLRQRQRQMMPRQYARELQETKQAGMASIREARAEVNRAIARDRQEALRENPSHLTGEWAARRTLYATQGMALAQSGMRDLERGIRDQLAAGNQVAAREYLNAGGSRLQDHMRQHDRVAELQTLRRAAASPTDARRAATVKGLDAYAEQTHRLDVHLRDLEGRLGQGDPDPEPGTQRHDLGRVVDLWHATANEASVDAGVAEVQQYQQAASELGAAEL